MCAPTIILEVINVERREKTVLWVVNYLENLWESRIAHTGFATTIDAFSEMCVVFFVGFGGVEKKIGVNWRERHIQLAPKVAHVHTA